MSWELIYRDCVLHCAGSGKTYTMQPLPLRAAADMFALLADPQFADLSLWVSCFEIYGGKLYDLLNGYALLDFLLDKSVASEVFVGIVLDVECMCRIEPQLPGFLHTLH